MNKINQLTIIGGGPAGVSAALSALNHGCEDIVIIEKEIKNRHRIGEILLTQTVLEFKELGIDEEIHEYSLKYNWGRKFGAAYVHGEDRTPWKVQNNHPLSSQLDQPNIPECFIDKKSQLWYTLMVRRHEFDESLREIAKKRGIKIIHGAVKDFHIIKEEEEDKSTITYLMVEKENGEMIKIHSQFIIDATGQQAMIPRKMKTRKVVDDWNLQARYAYFKNVDFEKAINQGLFKEGANILSFEDGWSWIANLGNNMTSVGIVSKYWDKNENNFWKKLSNLPEYKTFQLEKARVISFDGKDVEQDYFYAHPNYRFRSEVLRGKNWACVGDAAMFLDPLLSQGVTLAMSFGRLLGQTVVDIFENKVEAVDALKSYEKGYISELEVLNKVVTQWYDPSFEFDQNWKNTAEKISNIFGRKIGNDIESFRWISNLENIHHIIQDKHDKTFLKELNNVNQIKMIHNFEKDQLLNF